MKLNVGTVDRVLRILLAVVIGILYFTGNIWGITAIILGIFGIAFFVTAIIGFCPLYAPFGINTKKS